MYLTTKKRIFAAFFILYIFSCVVYGVLKKKNCIIYIYLITLRWMDKRKSCDPVYILTTNSKAHMRNVSQTNLRTLLLTEKKSYFEIHMNYSKNFRLTIWL